MKVYFDIITNHTADVIGYAEGARTAYVPKDVEPYRDASGTPFDDRDYAGGKAFPPLDPNVSFPYQPVFESGEQDLKVPTGSMTSRCITTGATRRSPARTRSTATSSGSTICSLSTRGWSTG